MKKYKARKEREQLEAIVKPRVSIEDPSAELLSPSWSWEREDPLQDSFLEQTEMPQATKDYHRVPKLKIRSTGDSKSVLQTMFNAQDEGSESPSENNSGYNSNSDISSAERSPVSGKTTMGAYDVGPEVVSESESTGPPSPQRHSSRTPTIPIRSRSLPPSRDRYMLSLSPPKTNFLAFSQRCAPSPTSTSPMVNTPIFELAAEEANFSIMGAIESEAPAELEGSPVELASLFHSPVNTTSDSASDSEPEASPYSRFAAFSKSIHALNANLSPIEETEEEAASRRSSTAQVYELPAITPFNPIPPSAYTGGTSITPRNYRYSISTIPDFVQIPARNTSIRSTESTMSSKSVHSAFSFEYSNSDTEKIYVATPLERRQSSAPSLTDVSSVDDFDIDLDLELDPKRSRSVSKRDAKLERFFGIRQYSVTSESDSSLNSDAIQEQSPLPDTFLDSPRSSASAFQPSHRYARSSMSIDDLDLSLAIENDPLRREIIFMHRSILNKTQSKQDAKLEKFFGCDKDQIQVARKCSTGSRLAGSNDDLKYRSIGW